MKKTHYVSNISILVTPLEEYIVLFMENKQWGLMGAFEDIDGVQLFASGVIATDMYSSVDFPYFGSDNKYDTSYVFTDKITGTYSGITSKASSSFNIFEQKPKPFPLNIRDIDSSNIEEFQSFLDSFVKKTLKVVDSNIAPYGILQGYKFDAQPLQTLNRHYKISEFVPAEQQSKLLSFCSFSKKYANKNIGEILFDSSSVAELVDNKIVLEKEAIEILHSLSLQSALSASVLPVENLTSLLSNDKFIYKFMTFFPRRDNLLDVYSLYVNHISKAFSEPSILCLLEELKKDAVSEIETAKKCDPSDKSAKTIEYLEKEFMYFEKSFLLFAKGFHDGKFVKDDKLDNVDKEIQSDIDTLLPAFVVEWNNIQKYSYNKETNLILPKLVDKILLIHSKMKIAKLPLNGADFGTNAKLNDLGEAVIGGKYKDMTYCYEKQYVKNKKPIVDNLARLYREFKDIEVVYGGEKRKLITEENISGWSKTLKTFSSQISIIDNEDTASTYDGFSVERVTSQHILEALRIHTESVESENKKASPLLMASSMT